ncbi:Nucleoside diphosphate-linked moiety X motif 19, mitochondrial [Clydaea vesicula]|uniref:Nucleoside diphosphate-linked moiety X motif 19, mitochondrial n=1 Tax=Clydaea vesicula TaxID=447962 RepID=A0AAD5TZ70_9FUNG|nr:Nucleoside diphosphate-linked moiety X motif 19, mitochondrial [Clydaea vesicula]
MKSTVKLLDKSSTKIVDKSMRRAASLIICKPIHHEFKDAPDFQVLLVKRNQRGLFKHLHVYPGGVVDDVDDIQHWPNLDSKTNFLLDHRIAAIRETFEETGIPLISPLPKLLKSQWKNLRSEVHNDAKKFLNLNKTVKALPQVDNLIHFSHWITPEIEKKRFDTHFFITTLLPDDPCLTEACADGLETMHLEWLRPDEALAKFRNGEIDFFPPQFCTLSDLTTMKFKDVQDIVEGKKFLPPVVPILPNPFLSEEGNVYFSLPGDEKHSTTMGNKGARNRIKIERREGGGFKDFLWERTKEFKFASKL